METVPCSLQFTFLMYLPLQQNIAGRKSGRSDGFQIVQAIFLGNGMSILVKAHLREDTKTKYVGQAGRVYFLLVDVPQI